MVEAFKKDVIKFFTTTELKLRDLLKANNQQNKESGSRDYDLELDIIISDWEERRKCLVIKVINPTLPKSKLSPIAKVVLEFKLVNPLPYQLKTNYSATFTHQVELRDNEKGLKGYEVKRCAYSHHDLNTLFDECTLKVEDFITAF